MRRSGRPLKVARRETWTFVRRHKRDLFEALAALLTALGVLAISIHLGSDRLVVGFVGGVSITVITCLLLFVLFEVSRENWLGALGERFTQEALADLVSQGYGVIRGLKLNGGDIDHIVVGPSGVFAIETKFRSRRSKTLWEFWLKSDVHKLRARVRSLKLLIESRTRHRVGIQSILILWGPDSSSLNVREIEGVRVFAAPTRLAPSDLGPQEEFPSYLASQILESLSTYKADQVKYEHALEGA